MGNLACIYRPAAWGDCSNNGISSHADMICVVNVDSPFEPSRNHPAAAIVHGPIGQPIIVPSAADGTPLDLPGSRTFGGNYAVTSDSRFPYPHPLPVHDRFDEWPR